MKNELKMYRVYGRDEYDQWDEYCEASSAQNAVDRVREWHSYDDRTYNGKRINYEVVEVAKVVKGWK